MKSNHSHHAYKFYFSFKFKLDQDKSLTSSWAKFIFISCVWTGQCAVVVIALSFLTKTKKNSFWRMMTVANFTLALEMECKSKAKVIHISDLISVLNINTCNCLLLKGAFTFAKIKEFIWSLRNVHWFTSFLYL